MTPAAPAPLNKAEWMKLATTVPPTTRAAADAWATLRQLAEASRWQTGESSPGEAALAASVQRSPAVVSRHVQAGVRAGCITRTATGRVGRAAVLQLAWPPGLSGEAMAARMVEALAAVAGRKPSSRRREPSPTGEHSPQGECSRAGRGVLSGSAETSPMPSGALPSGGVPSSQTHQEEQQQQQAAAAAALYGSPQDEDSRLAGVLAELERLRADLEAERSERRAADERHAVELAALERRLTRAELEASRDVKPVNPPAAATTPPAASAPAGALGDLDRLLAAAEPRLAAPGGDEHREAARDVAEVLTAGVDALAVPLDERLGVLGHVLRKLHGADPAKRPREPHRLAWTLLLGPAEKRLDSSARESGRRWLAAGPPKPEASSVDQVRAEMEARRQEAEELSRAVQAERAEAARADREAAISGAPKPFDGDELAAARARLAALGTVNPRRPALGASQRVELQRAGKPLTADVAQAPAPPDVEGALRLLLPARAQA